MASARSRTIARSTHRAGMTARSRRPRAHRRRRRPRRHASGDRRPPRTRRDGPGGAGGRSDPGGGWGRRGFRGGGGRQPRRSRRPCPADRPRRRPRSAVWGCRRYDAIARADRPPGSSQARHRTSRSQTRKAHPMTGRPRSAGTRRPPTRGATPDAPLLYIRAMPDEAVAALSGLVASFLSGLLGIGGGLVLTPLLLYLPPLLGAPALSVKIVTGLTIVQAISGSVLGAIRHGRYGNVSRRIVWLMGPSSAVASLAGAFVSRDTPDHVLLLIFAVMAFAGAIMLLLPVTPRPGIAADVEVNRPLAIALALMLGFFCGMGVVGGGPCCNFGHPLRVGPPPADAAIISARGPPFRGLLPAGGRWRLARSD